MTELLRFAPTAVASALLLACVAAPPTPYQPAVGGFGYSDQRLERTRWRVTFTSSGSTPPATADIYLLYRAAELTLQNDHDWFVLVDRTRESGRFLASAEIVIGKGETPTDDLNAYDALDLARNLEPAIRRPAG